MKNVVLLLNLGTPKSPNHQDVRNYLNQFLMDPEVIDLPWLWRALLVKLFILPFRTTKSAQSYQKIWTSQGSPLLTHGLNLANKLQEKLLIPVYLAMRYSEPSINDTLIKIKRQNKDINQIIAIPLYPHYANATVKTCTLELHQQIKKICSHTKLTIIPPFYQNIDYITALSACTKKYLSSFEHILFSYHGLPIRHLTKEKPNKTHCLKKNCCSTYSPAHETCYRHQVLQTTDAFARHNNLTQEQYTVTFQSRLGKAQWLKPYTSTTIIDLAKSGIKNLLVICPSFVADCLETLEEIDIQGRQTFMNAGGQTFTLAPCLNTHHQWITTLAKWVKHIETL